MRKKPHIDLVAKSFRQGSLLLCRFKRIKINCKPGAEAVKWKLEPICRGAAFIEN